METEIQKVDEFANLEESFTDLVKAGKEAQAIKLVENITKRLSDARTAWDDKIAPLKKAIRKRERLQQIEKTWVDYDKRLKRLQKHHLDYYEEIYQDRGRDVEDLIKVWDCKGNEKFRCGNSKSRWNDQLEFCNFFTNNEIELHLHKWDHKHGVKEDFLREHYPHAIFWMNNGKKLHLKDKHNSYSEKNVFLIDETMKAQKKGDYGHIRIQNFSHDSLCRQCFKNLSICGKCKGPTSNDKCFFCQ